MPGDTAIFVLCGLGDRCAIRGGKPSPERSQLLRRESFELGLYALKCNERTASVLVFQPPKPGEDPTLALLVRRDGVRPHLSRPVTDTLPSRPPRPKALAKDRKQSTRIVNLTSTSLFAFSFQRLPDGTPVVVLDEPA